MLSIIITSKNEAKTIGPAVRSFLISLKKARDLQIYHNFLEDWEIIVVAPDPATLVAAKQEYAEIKLIQDDNQGKPAAMNLAIRQAMGDWLIFADGDAFVDPNAVGELFLSGQAVVTGRPAGRLEMQNPKAIANGKLRTSNMFDYWQFALYDVAHRLREKRVQAGKFLLISGYLFLIKKDLLREFKYSANLVTEDEYLSYYLWHKNISINYAPKAKVYVKFPQTWQDFMRQKARSFAGGSQIPKKLKQGIEMRSFGREILGSFQFLRYIHSLRQLLWIKLLFLARLEAWFLAWWKIRIKKQQGQKIWPRVESSK